MAKLVVEELESDALRAVVLGRTLTSSRLSVVEVGKAVARVAPEVDPQPVLATLAFVEMDAELAATAAGTGSPQLRALDAIHVASALRLGGEVESFITYDDRQGEAARTAGLRVQAPGRQSGSADPAVP